MVGRGDESWSGAGDGGRPGEWMEVEAELERERLEFFGREKLMEKVLSCEMADGGRGGKSDGDGE